MVEHLPLPRVPFSKLTSCAGANFRKIFNCSLNSSSNQYVLQLCAIANVWHVSREKIIRSVLAGEFPRKIWEVWRKEISSPLACGFAFCPELSYFHNQISLSSYSSFLLKNIKKYRCCPAFLLLLLFVRWSCICDLIGCFATSDSIRVHTTKLLFGEPKCNAFIFIHYCWKQSIAKPFEIESITWFDLYSRSLILI